MTEKEVPRYAHQRLAMQSKLIRRLVDHSYGPGGWKDERLKRYVYMAAYGATWRNLCRTGALRPSQHHHH